ncbi:MAG: T9SS C-terminal target domain-containing protein [Ignavibacteriales bacterium]|nr:MAG: T9SS C-terminal target domain-containing protein [Ignavibacteriales bacterium]
MKKLFFAIIIAIAVYFFSSGEVHAAVNDTLTIHALDGNLEQIINGDTTNTGMQAHKAYKLVSLDTTYVFQGPVSVKSDFTIVGVLGADGRPPCIQPMTLPDGSLPIRMFSLNGANTKAVFKNLYLTGRSTDNTIASGIDFDNGAGSIIQVAAEGIRLTVDNVVFCDWPTNNIAYSANNVSLFVTNCKFRNATNSGAWYSGEAVRNTYNSASSDSIVMKYNTMFCIAYSCLCPVTINPAKYLEFSHNSVIYTFKNPFWIYNMTDGKVNDNLFYAPFSGGSNFTEHFGMWDQLRSFAVTGVVDFDTLLTPMAEWLDPADIGNPNFMWLAEAKRNIEVKNNICYWPQAVRDIWTAWNDTAHVDSIVTPVWMNERTIGMFADDVHWPGLVAAGNLEVDPQFGSSFNDIIFNNTECGDGFKDYFRVVRSNEVGTVAKYGYKLETVEGDNWIPLWPLPELQDMQYSNAALKTGGTDGKPIGDPGWFTGGITAVDKDKNQLPDKFVLENAFPNPFNPSTTIKFSIAKDGNVNLKIFDILGQSVKTILNNEYKNMGTYEFNVDMNGFANGLYFYTLQQDEQQITKKMILLK